MLTEPHILSAYLYLHTGEQMPEPVLDADGELDVAADNAAIEAWSQGSDPAVALLEMNRMRLRKFIAMTEVLLIDLEQIELDENEPAAPQYMTLFYDAAKDVFDHDKSQLRTYFAWLYYVVYQRSEGPRWGDFVEIYGVESFIAHVRNRFGDLIHGS